MQICECIFIQIVVWLYNHTTIYFHIFITLRIGLNKVKNGKR